MCVCSVEECVQCVCSVPSVPSVCAHGGCAPASVDAHPPRSALCQDTEAKLRALGPALRGDMLDVCTGLGYTAIVAAREARVTSVTTIELDPLMVRMYAHLYIDPLMVRCVSVGVCVFVCVCVFRPADGACAVRQSCEAQP